MRVGLTGGVGSGKSTVAALLAEHGAVVIDADAIAREVVEPGTPGFDAVVAQFGDGVVGADGRLDRPALAAHRLRATTPDAPTLNAIVHPLVGARIGRAGRGGARPTRSSSTTCRCWSRATWRPASTPCSSSRRRSSCGWHRLAERGMAEDDARERMAAQASDEQRRAVADEVIVNDGVLDQLAAAGRRGLGAAARR